MVSRNPNMLDQAVAKVRRLCDQRVPPGARDEVRLEVTPEPPPLAPLRRPRLHPRLDDLLKEIDDDPLTLFWGQRRFGAGGQR
jgi:hypothetical protein